MQVSFTNTTRTAGTVDGRDFTISAAGKIWVNRARPSKAAAAAIEAALAAPVKAAKPAKAEKPAKAAVAKKQPATFGSMAMTQLADKPAAKKAAPAGARSATLSDNMTITVLVEGNPKREGCAAYERFQNYFSVSTVAEALAAGLTRKDLAWDIAHGHINVK